LSRTKKFSMQYLNNEAVSLNKLVFLGWVLVMNSSHNSDPLVSYQ